MCGASAAIETQRSASAEAIVCSASTSQYAHAPHRPGMIAIVFSRPSASVTARSNAARASGDV